MLGLISAYAAVTVTAEQIFRATGVGGVNPAIGLVIPYAMLFGMIGVASGVLAVILVDVFRLAVSMETITVSAGHLLGGYLSYRLAIRIVGVSETNRWMWPLARFTLVAVAGSAAIAATIGLLHEIVARAPFYLSGIIAIQYLLATMTLGLFAFAISRGFWPAYRVTGPVAEGARRMVALTVVIAVGWLLLGVLGSAGFYNLMRIPAFVLADIGLEAIRPLADPRRVGPRALYPQLVLGSLALGLLVLIFRSDRRDREAQACD